MWAHEIGHCSNMHCKTSLLTRLPSNLRPTTHECVYLVMCGRFQSRDKDSSHTIRLAIAENLMLHANFKALCSVPVEPELLLIEVLRCGNRNFGLVLLMWPWTWPDDLHIKTWPIYPGIIPDELKRTFFVKAFESYRLTTIDRQTPSTLYTMLLHRWSACPHERSLELTHVLSMECRSVHWWTWQDMYWAQEIVQFNKRCQ